MSKTPTEYQVNVGLSLLALFFDQLDQIDIPPGDDDDDPLAENFRYIKAHFSSTVKLMKTITSGAALIEENEIDQSNIEAVLELIQTLPEPEEGATGNEDVHVIRDYVIAFLNYYYAFTKTEIPEKRDRSSSTVSKNLIESLSRKSKSKISKQDQVAINDGPKEDPIEQLGLPQDTKPAAKHMRTKSHMKDPPETIEETESEHKPSARIRSTSRDKEFGKKIDEVESDSESRHVPTPRGDSKAKLFAVEGANSNTSEPSQSIHSEPIPEEIEESTVIHENSGLPEIIVPVDKPHGMDSIDASPIPTDKRKPTGQIPAFELEKSMEVASPESKDHKDAPIVNKSKPTNKGGSRNISSDKKASPKNKKTLKSRSREPANKKNIGKSIDTIQEESASKQDESEIVDEIKHETIEKTNPTPKGATKKPATTGSRDKSASKDKQPLNLSKSKEPAKLKIISPKPEATTKAVTAPIKDIKEQSKEAEIKNKPKENTKPVELKKDAVKPASKTAAKSKEPTKQPEKSIEKSKEPAKVAQKGSEKTKEPLKSVQKAPEKSKEPAKVAESKSKSKDIPSKQGVDKKALALHTKPADSSKKTTKVSKEGAKKPTVAETKKPETKISDAKAKSVSKEKVVDSKKSEKKGGVPEASTKPDSKATSVQAKTFSKTDRTSSASKDKAKERPVSARKDDSLNTSKASAKTTSKNVLGTSASTSKAKSSSVAKSNLKNKSETIAEVPEEESDTSPLKNKKTQDSKSKVAKSNVSQAQSTLRNSSAAKSKNASSVDKSKVSAVSKGKAAFKDKPVQDKNINLSKISSVQSENESMIGKSANKGRKTVEKPEEDKSNWKKNSKAGEVKADEKSKSRAKAAKEIPKPPTQSKDKKAANLKDSQPSGRGRVGAEKAKKESKILIVEPSEESESVDVPVEQPTPETTALKRKIPNLDLALGSLKSSASYTKYKGTIKSTRRSKNSTNFISRNVGELGDKKWQTQSNKLLTYKPNFPDTDFVYVREHKEQQLRKQATLKLQEQAKKAKTEADDSQEKAEGDEEQASELDEAKKSRPESAKLAPKRDEKLETMFKRFSDKTEKLYARAQSAKPIQRAKYGQTKYERMMAKGPSNKLQGGPSIVSRFQQDSDLLMNHVKRKEEAVNPTLLEIEKERALITQMKLRQSTLMFELERSHRNKLKEEEKLEQEEESEFKREQRVKGKEYDLEKAKQERALDRQRKQDQLAESKRIKKEIKQIMEENFEAEQNFHVMHF